VSTYSDSVQFNLSCSIPGYWARVAKVEAERRAARERRAFLELAEVILDLVHPGQFNALPPSPRAIAHKAWLLGLD
jgi:hypothetical protein